MQLSFRIAALAAVCLLAGVGATTSPTKAELEAFEQFAASPDARIAWSNEIGRIDTDQGRAIVSALVVEDTSGNTGGMRGLRIDLTSGQSRDRVYTSEEHLDRLIDTMQQIAVSVPSHLSGPGGCHGSGEFLLEMRQDVHAFSASECDLGDWAGLAVGPGDIRFTNKGARHFVDLFRAARDELSRQTD